MGGGKIVQTHRKGTPVCQSNMGLGGVKKSVEEREMLENKVIIVVMKTITETETK